MVASTELLGVDLRVAIGRVSRRLRRIYAAGVEPDRPSFLELAVLQRVQRDPVQGVAADDLAPQERVTVQAVSAAVAALRHRASAWHPGVDEQDRRRTRVHITASGIAMLAGREQALDRRLRDAVATLTPDEQKSLRDAVPVLDRLADVL